MESAIISGALGLLDGVSHLGLGQVVMMAIGAGLLYLGIRKGFEPLLLVPIGFGAILVNIPQAELMARGRHAAVLLRLRHPHRDLPGADLHRHRRHDRLRAVVLQPQDHHAGGGRPVRHLPDRVAGPGTGVFSKLDAVAIGVIGACDGPTSIYVKLALRAAPAGGGVGGGLLVHVAGAADPARRSCGR